jgi:chromosome partitioning protein
MGHVIAISNVKGGVAKTSTSSALGRSISKLGYSVLLVDLDAQADLTTSVGIAQSNVAYGTKDLFSPGLLEKLGINNFILPTIYEKLDIMPSKGEIDWYDKGLAEANDSLLKDLFDTKLRERYDFIVMDCAPAINIYALNALTAADLVIVPTQAEYFSANSLIKMMRIIRHVRQRGRPELAYRVLVTMYVSRTRIQQTVMEEFRKGFGENLLDSYIEIDTKIRESQSAHIPIVDYKPISRGSIQYQNLCREVMEYFKQNDKQPQQDIPPAEQATTKNEDALQAFCPFLGFKDDIKTVMNYPSDLNHCHRASKAGVPKLEHQTTNCLTQSYLACPMLKTSKKIALLPELQERPPSLWNRIGF